MKYSRYDYRYCTLDGKLEFRAGWDRKSKQQYPMHVVIGIKLVDEPEQINLVKAAGLLAVIELGERQIILQAVHAVLTEAGYSFDTRCRMNIVWQTADRQWQLWEKNGRWVIRPNPDVLFGMLPVLEPVFHTRNSAVDWAQANYTPPAGAHALGEAIQ